MKNSAKRKPKINNRIRYCRTAISIGQKELAFLMGVPSSQVSRWEKGRREPGIYNAIGLAVVTRRLVEDIFLDYRREWQEKIRKRARLLDSKEKASLKKTPKLCQAVC